MVIHMAAVVTYTIPGFTSIKSNMRNCFYRVHLINIYGVAIDLVIVLSACMMAAHLFP